VTSLRIYNSVAKSGVDRHEPEENFVSENFLKVVVNAEVKSLLVGAGSAPEDWCPEGFERCPVSRDEIEVVREQRRHAQREHGADEEQEQDVKPVRIVIFWGKFEISRIPKTNFKATSKNLLFKRTDFKGPNVLEKG